MPVSAIFFLSDDRARPRGRRSNLHRDIPAYGLGLLYDAQVIRLSEKTVPTILLAAACSAVGFISTRAWAVEHQWRTGVDAGWAGFSDSRGVYSGVAVGGHAACGLTDSYDLLLEGDTSFHPVGNGYSAVNFTHVSVGAAYSLDIVTWVPYFGLLVGGYRVSGGGLEQAHYDLGFQAALGLDYRFSPSWSTGVQVRYHTFREDPLSVHYMTSLLRFEYVAGW